MALSDWHALRSILRFENRAASASGHACGDLRTRYLVMERHDAWREVRKCIERLDDRWRIEDETPSAGQIRLSRKSRLRMFTDDVTVQLWPADDGRVGIDVTSSSRIGRIDFGQNARNVRDFYRALEASLQELPEPGRDGTED